MYSVAGSHDPGRFLPEAATRDATVLAPTPRLSLFHRYLLNFLNTTRANFLMYKLCLWASIWPKAPAERLTYCNVTFFGRCNNVFDCLIALALLHSA